MKRLVTIGILAGILAGCVSDPARRAVPNQEELTRQAEDNFRDIPAVVKVKLSPGQLQVMGGVPQFPVEMDREITADFRDADLYTVLYSVMKGAGLSVAFRIEDTTAQPGGIPSPGMVPGQPGQFGQNESTRRKVTISYRGKVSGFLQTLSQATGYFLSYRNGVLVAKPVDNFSISIPSYEELLKEMETSVKALGGSQIAYDRLSGRLSFTADAPALERIKDYCAAVRDNAALISMRIMILNVKLSNSTSTGIDWTTLAFGSFSQKRPTGINASSDTTSTGDDSGAGTDTSLPGAQWKNGVGALMGSTGATIFAESAQFSLNLLFNFLREYGRFTVTQNILAQALSGTKGHLDVLTETPFVSEVSFTALSNQSANVSQAVKTSTAKAGVEFDILPVWSKADGALSIRIKANVLGVNRYVTLDAGQQIGRITQPETTKKGVDTFVRMSPSMVAVIGGLVFERNNDNSRGLPGDSYLTRSYTTDGEKEELVVVVKPTVIEFE